MYHDPDILVMDEATSALDGVTEQKVIQATRMLSSMKTTITIAHRVTTLINCDTIYVLEGGKIVESGSFDYLRKESQYFKSVLQSNIE